MTPAANRLAREENILHLMRYSGYTREAATAIVDREDRYRFGGPNYNRISTPDGV